MLLTCLDIKRTFMKINFVAGVFFVYNIMIQMQESLSQVLEVPVNQTSFSFLLVFQYGIRMNVFESIEEYSNNNPSPASIFRNLLYQVMVWKNQVGT